MKELLEFFELKDEPFRLTPDCDYFFPSSSHSVALKLMEYSLNDPDGFVLLTGSPGMGKTTLIRKLFEKLDEKWETVLIVAPMLKPEELMEAILSDLNLEASSNTAKNFQKLQDYLIELARNNKKLLLVIDEAQNLPVETLEQIRLLSNIETSTQKPLQIILSGQPELEQKVKQNIAQLDQRITVRCTLKPLSKDETKDYIKFRFSKANGRVDITKSALEIVYKYSGGIPRLINSIMKRALLMAFSDNSKTIEVKHIKAAVESLGLKKNQIPVFYIIGILIAIVLIALIVYFFKRS